MKANLPKKIAVIGLPGSGKSTFASKLGEILGIPVHHLDRHMFEPDGKKKDKHQFIEIQQALLSEAAWIVEGCSYSTFEMRFANAETLIYFRLPRLLCFMRMIKRIFNYEKRFGGLRTINWGILKYTWSFNYEKGSRIKELRRKYPNTEFLVFRSQKEVDLYLKAQRSIVTLDNFMR